jgi:hypothetical protein
MRCISLEGSFGVVYCDAFFKGVSPVEPLVPPNISLKIWTPVFYFAAFSFRSPDAAIEGLKPWVADT